MVSELIQCKLFFMYIFNLDLTDGVTIFFPVELSGWVDSWEKNYILRITSE